MRHPGLLVAVAAVPAGALAGSRPRGRPGGRTFALSKAQVRLAQAAMAHRDTSVSALCRELGIRPAPRLAGFGQVDNRFAQSIHQPFHVRHALRSASGGRRSR